MIVIVETTFIVELVIEQDEAPACEEILRLTAAHHATLAIPAFSLAEAGMMLERQQGERKRLVSELAEDAKKLRRSRTRARYTNGLEELRSELLRINDIEDQRFVNYSWSRMKGVEIIPLTQEMMDEAVVFRQTGIMKKLPDAIVYTSVLGFLDGVNTNTPICFVTPDKAFVNPKVVAMLRRRHCTLMSSFADAVGWIQRYSRPSN